MKSFKDFLREEDKKKTKTPKKDVKKRKKCNKLGISNKEATHAGMSYYSPGEL